MIYRATLQLNFAEDRVNDTPPSITNVSKVNLDIERSFSTTGTRNTTGYTPGCRRVQSLSRKG